MTKNPKSMNGINNRKKTHCFPLRVSWILFYAGYSGLSFLATFDVGTLTPTDPIVFNNPVHNSGGHYDPTTGIYTVPQDGIFQFFFRIIAYEDSSTGAFLIVDDVQVWILCIKID